MSTRMHHIAIVTVALAAAVAGCSQDARAGASDGDAAAEPSAEVCRLVERSIPLAGAVSEPSGAALSRRHKGIFWTHGDSGSEPEVFAVRMDGSLAGRTRVTGATHDDWEDVAVGPCPGGSCLYIADIGDNDAKRKEISIYRVPEPAPGTPTTGPAERFTAKYPKGEHDAEALFVLPSGEVFLVTKGVKKDPVELYRWPTPLRAGAPATLVPVRTLAEDADQVGDRVTGASASPDGKWVAIRTYATLALYRTAELVGSSEVHPRLMDLAPLGESQGEGVSIGSDGEVVLTSEGSTKKQAGQVSRLRCELD